MQAIGYVPARLAQELSDKADRRLDGERLAWDRKTVERFIHGANPTQEMVDAFCALFPQLLPPFYAARTKTEAIALRRESSKFNVESNPELASRKDVLVKARRGIEQKVQDQSAGVASDNEGPARDKGATVGGRARGVARGGRTPS